MQNYRLDIAYDGSRYEGWQRQKRSENTIQGKLETVLTRMVGAPVEINGAGRTDAGVHAMGQVANVHLETTMEETEIAAYLNHYLPEDIGVQRVQRIDARFHARLSARGKQYRYRIETGYPKHIFERKYLWSYGEKLDVECMKQAASYLIGMHDFRSFCGNKNHKKSTVRTIRSIVFEERENELVITFTGDGFLQYMIRILVGTLVECGSGKRRPEDVLRVLAGLNREEAGFTAPACGLTLVSVFYGDEM